MPSTLTFAARVYPPVRGLSATVGVDVGLTGTSTFVRELAANKPYDVRLAVAYALDPEPLRERVEVEVERKVQLQPPLRARIDGRVVDRETGAPVEAAAVAYPDLDLTTQQTDAGGRFVSYALDGGEVVLAVSHPDYEARRCTASLPPARPQPPAAADASQQPASPTPAIRPSAPPAQPAPPGTAPASPSAGPAGEGPRVALRCELTPRPRVGALQGRVDNDGGKPVADAEVILSGASSHTLRTDPAGAFAMPQLPAGDYSIRVEAEGYLIKLVSAQVPPGQTVTPVITLLPKPKQAQVQLTQEEVRIRRQIFFKTGSAEIRPRSDALLSEIADVLLRNPQVEHVEIQGHTDNTGTPELNQDLSQRRAEAVRDWLVNAGVEPQRLTARGYGDTRPLMPNLTDRNRARNRRVQFIIREP
jgi:outer membrane protein OmpA-like peptidoglycan-associated protein